MTKLFLLIFLIISLLFLYSFIRKKGAPISTIYGFKISTIDGDTLDFATLKGKKILIVNTASKCGFTPQFEQLETLYKTYKDQNFIIIGFPCNQFGNQDPGSGSDIKSFCAKNYGVTFPMMEKVNVKGTEASDIYKWLTSKEKNGVENSSVKWNFQKYLIDENGFLIGHVASFKSPDCKKIVTWIVGK